MIYLIDGNAKAQLAALKDYAEENLWTEELFQAQLEGKQKPPGDIEGYHVTLWGSIKVVFTIGQDPNGPKLRVMSLSNLDDPRQLPHEPVFESILQELGYKKPIAECIIMQEEILDDDRLIITVAEQIK